ncbi:hypothetical protein VTL71DRAFT_5328 [Oculimacula yallundae]|uniref:Uncharacterized protein n=1 Tax=Oculimacula yallundae TaxID=86028 RepID=A0ABR4C0R9_9HELO
MLPQLRSKHGQKPDLVSVQALRSESDPSLLSGNTGSSGPSNKEPALITSKWTIGWETPTLMVASYTFALAVAITHLILFKYIDGKEADGPNRIAPQAYIATASNILANTFGFSLRASLAIAFVQHLWHLLRVTSMKVSTIETLFCVRANPFLLFKTAVLRATPLLCGLASIIWVSQVVTSFPPGAISVASSQTISFVNIQVPIYNASFMGNGSAVDADKFSLNSLTPSDIMDGFVTGTADRNKNGNLLSRLAKQVLVAGETFNMPSPCGVNCSYVVQFEAPYMTCNTTTVSIRYDNAYQVFPVYTGKWIQPFGVPPNPADRSSGTYTLARFNSSTLFPLKVNGTKLDGAGNSSALMQRDDTICRPARARYTVNNTWHNNVPSRNVSAELIDRLTNLVIRGSKDGTTLVPGFIEPKSSPPDLGHVPANWSVGALTLYRDSNMVTIIASMMSWLNGTFEGFLAGTGPAFQPGFILESFLPVWNEQVKTTVNGVTDSFGAHGGTVIDSTRFNDAFGRYSPSENAHPSFNITQDLMNEYLFNITTSMMLAYGSWTTTVNATRLTSHNVYAFSQPLSLLLPYFITLFISLPFVVIGCLSLFKNGVSALDGSFTQIITTSTGSAVLDRAAAGGCLGGNESLPDELKNMEIRFGEFVGRDDPGRIKRAGFGVEGEIKTLEKGEVYGVARWI